ncbi:preprotein translocase subunit SecF [Luteimonas cucumeris]|uniref:Protein-export membrane protein SecF n=1 Tax=Luteimonas cucumeris TaxID=985012 RepID=A0A562LBH1_9GAMM|nr:protein translocase subunit SecF [Luteimonas cucumeris]TWI05007.1 preprotein translocase subunit SecF [Luteimonas cucumeris]
MKIFPLNLIPYGTKIDFMRMRWVSLTVAALLTLASIVAIATMQFNFALDFTGGTSVEVRFAKLADVDAVRSKLADAGYTSAQVQTFGSGNDLLIRLQGKEGAGQQTDPTQIADHVVSIVTSAGNPAQRMSSGYVGSQVGKELAWNGIWALLFVMVGFLAYISFRFEWKFAVSAIITTLSDIIIVAGWFAVTQHEFDLTVLAGILSALGYSINDKIVVFDRVRENFRAMRAPPREILNASINQTLSRTIIVSFVAFLTVLALYLYGGGSLQGMAEAQMIGIVLGTLSSIFVACPLLTIGPLQVSKQDLMPKAKDEAALARRP